MKLEKNNEALVEIQKLCEAVMQFKLVQFKLMQSGSMLSP